MSARKRKRTGPPSANAFAAASPPAAPPAAPSGKPLVEQWPRWLRIFAAVLAAIVVLHAAWLLLDYNACYDDTEDYGHFYTAALRNGKALSWSDFRNAVDAWGLDGDARPRFVSYYCSILTYKARLALWKYLPPHPSWSPVWLFTLFVGPWFLYRLLILTAGSRTWAIIGVALYLSTTGFLSAHTYLVHPAKPLSVLALIMMLYYSARANRDAVAADHSLNPRLSMWIAGRLLLFFPLLLFSDETVLFCFVVLPICSFQYFFPRRWNWPNVGTCLVNGAVCLAPAAIYMAIVLLVAPAVCSRALGHKFDMVSAAMRMEDSGKAALTEGSSRLDASHLARNSATLMSASLAPWQATGVGFPMTTAKELSGQLVLLLGVFAIATALATYAVWRTGKFWAVYWRTALLAPLFLLFITFVMSHHPLEIVMVGYYYASMFSVLMAVLCTYVAASLAARTRWGSLAGAALVCYVAAVQIANFHVLNNIYRDHLNWKDLLWLQFMPYNPCFEHLNMREIPPLYSTIANIKAAEIPHGPALSAFDAILRSWRQWGRNDSCYWSQESPLPLRDVWIIAEGYAMRTPSKLADIPREQLLGQATSAGAAMPLISWEHAMAYQLALGRSESETTHPGVLPVLACLELSPEGPYKEEFWSGLAYPWIPGDLRSGMNMLLRVGYNRFLLPADQAEVPDGPYWDFHRAFVGAWRSGTLANAGIHELGRLKIAGREVIVLGPELRPALPLTPAQKAIEEQEAAPPMTPEERARERTKAN